VSKRRVFDTYNWRQMLQRSNWRQAGCCHNKQNKGTVVAARAAATRLPPAQQGCAEYTGRQHGMISTVYATQVLRRHCNATAYAFQLDGDYIVKNGWRLRAACVRLQKECRHRSAASGCDGCKAVGVRGRAQPCTL
jgi:hypothetical protein